MFEILERFGGTDMLVREPAQGHALAETLGGAAVVLMRGHGYCVLGDSVPVAVYRAIYTDTKATALQKAIALGGEVTCLDAGEARLADETNCGVVDRPWALWKARVRGGT